MNIPFKLLIKDVNNAVKSTEQTLHFPSGKNAYRISKIRFSFPALDTVAAGDYAGLQLAYKDLNADSLLEISDDAEIFTYINQMIGTKAGTVDLRTDVAEQIRTVITLLDGRDFSDLFIVKDKFWINAINSGQDGAIDCHIEISGKYVKLPDSDIEKSLHQRSL
jgi:hypothetical protein